MLKLLINEVFNTFKDQLWVRCLRKTRYDPSLSEQKNIAPTVTARNTRPSIGPSRPEELIQWGLLKEYFFTPEAASRSEQHNALLTIRSEHLITQYKTIDWSRIFKRQSSTPIHIILVFQFHVFHSKMNKMICFALNHCSPSKLDVPLMGFSPLEITLLLGFLSLGFGSFVVGVSFTRRTVSRCSADGISHSKLVRC